ncbi:hypothetical protein CLAIMM_14950 [Cladophialophora immunda]|nr:hypothetical protein CLAIMM_14950 [Cladophialophora immunda]
MRLDNIIPRQHDGVWVGRPRRRTVGHLGRRLAWFALNYIQYPSTSLRYSNGTRQRDTARGYGDGIRRRDTSQVRFKARMEPSQGLSPMEGVRCRRSVSHNKESKLILIDELKIPGHGVREPVLAGLERNGC